MKGYQLIEADLVYKLSGDGNSTRRHAEYLFWIVSELNNDSMIKALPVEISLVVAEYVGRYPCIAVHYLDEGPEDIEAIVVRQIEALYRVTTTAGVLDFIERNKTEIDQWLANHWNNMRI